MMIAFFRRHPLMLSLAALATVLVVVIGLELGFGTRLRSALNPSAPKRAAAAEAKLLPPLLAAAPEQAYPETATRPLFTPTRRPAPPAEAAAAAQPAFKRGQFVLQGVTIVGDNRIALLREKSSGRIHRVARGREVNGIKVAEIQPEAVTLALGAETEVLTLDVQKAGAAPAAAVTVGPFAPAAASSPQPAAFGEPPPAQPVASMPIPARIPGVATMPAGVFPAPASAPGANPPQPSAPEATTNPMSPEELLARRRARRTQQNQ
jgi:general secretion pathway protein N